MTTTTIINSIRVKPPTFVLPVPVMTTLPPTFLLALDFLPRAPSPDRRVARHRIVALGSRVCDPRQVQPAAAQRRDDRQRATCAHVVGTTANVTATTQRRLAFARAPVAASMNMIAPLAD